MNVLHRVRFICVSVKKFHNFELKSLINSTCWLSNNLLQATGYMVSEIKCATLFLTTTLVSRLIFIIFVHLQSGMSIVQIKRKIFNFALFHRCTHTVYLYNGCLAWYNVLKTSRVREIAIPEGATNKIHGCGLVRRWNKCVKPLPVVKVR